MNLDKNPLLSKPSFIEMRNSGVYCIKNNVNDLIYIGSCVNFANRLAGHKLDYKRGKGNRNLKNFIDEYGWCHIIFEILEITEDLKEKENFWISKYDFEKLWNVAPSAYSNKGATMPESHKTKSSKRMKGTTHCRGYKHSKEKGEKCAKYWEDHPEEKATMIEKNRESQKKIDRGSWEKGYIVEVYLNGNLLDTVFGIKNVSSNYPIGKVSVSKLLNNKKDSFNGYTLKKIGKFFKNDKINRTTYF